MTYSGYFTLRIRCLVSSVLLIFFIFYFLLLAVAPFPACWRQQQEARVKPAQFWRQMAKLRAVPRGVGSRPGPSEDGQLESYCFCVRHITSKRTRGHFFARSANQRF